MKNHYAILSSLYKLYEENKDNVQVLDHVSAIAWALEFDLNFDTYGYHELAELTKTPSSDSNSTLHYTKVIEESLEKLKSQA